MAKMSFDLNEFRALINKVGIQRPTMYAVNITPPASVTSPIVNSLPLLCTGTFAPGTSFQTDMYRHKGYGIEDRRPNGLNPEDVTLTFINDGQSKISKFFDKWANKIFNFHSSTGRGSERLGYPNDYYSTIEVYLYDPTGDKVSTYTYEDAWPLNVGNIQLGWDMNDVYTSLPVTFAYRSHFLETVSEATKYNSDQIENTTNKIDRRVAAIQTATSSPTISEYLKRIESI